jgi:hypothetical protein
MANIKRDFIIDSDVKAVLEFMAGNVSVSKLIGVADSLPLIARTLWQHYPQDSFRAADFAGSSFVSADEKLPVSIE